MVEEEEDEADDEDEDDLPTFLLLLFFNLFLDKSLNASSVRASNQPSLKRPN